MAEQDVDPIPKWPWLIAPALVAVLFAVRYYVGVEDPAPTDVASPTVVAESGEAGLRVRAFADKSRVSVSERVRLRVSLEQHAGDLRGLSLKALDVGVFSRVGECWAPGSGSPDCAAGQTTRGGFEAVRVAGRSSVSLWAELQAPRDAGSQLLVLNVVAVDALQVERQATLNVGPIEVIAPPAQLDRAARHAYGVAKDFGLPLIGAFMAFFFQRWQRRREHAQETWKSIFPHAHENVVRRLLPMTAHARGFLARAADPAAWDSASLDGRQALHNLMILTRKMFDLSRTGGGIFLRDLAGEELVMLCWTWLRDRLYARLGTNREALFQVLDKMKDDDSFVAFEARFKAPTSSYVTPAWAPELGAVRAALDSWVNDPGFEVDRQVLVVFGEALQYEIDKLYGAWYGRPTDTPKVSITALQEMLGPRPYTLQTTTLDEALSKYLKRLA